MKRAQKMLRDAKVSYSRKCFFLRIPAAIFLRYPYREQAGQTREINPSHWQILNNSTANLSFGACEKERKRNKRASYVTRKRIVATEHNNMRIAPLCKLGQSSFCHVLPGFRDRQISDRPDAPSSNTRCRKERQMRHFVLKKKKISTCNKMALRLTVKFEIKM